MQSYLTKRRNLPEVKQRRNSIIEKHIPFPPMFFLKLQITNRERDLVPDQNTTKVKLFGGKSVNKGNCTSMGIVVFCFLYTTRQRLEAVQLSRSKKLKLARCTMRIACDLRFSFFTFVKDTTSLEAAFQYFHVTYIRIQDSSPLCFSCFGFLFCFCLHYIIIMFGTSFVKICKTKTNLQFSKEKGKKWTNLPSGKIKMNNSSDVV